MISKIYKNNFRPESIAIQFKGEEITYKELDNKVDLYAKYFSSIGIKKGDRVAISSINCPEFIYSYLGVTQLGAVIVPINVMLTIEEIGYIIKNSESIAMIVHPYILEKAKISPEFIKGALGINVIVLGDNLESQFSSVSDISYDESSDENEISTFIYTSGTTGKPKAAMLTNKNLLANCIQSFNTMKYYPEDNVLCVLPMFHSFAFTVCVLYTLYCGSTVVILESFQPKEVVETLLGSKISVFVGVPTMYVVLIEAAKAHISFPNMRVAISGGSSLPEAIYEQCKKALNLPIIEGYGLSEASPIVTFNPYEGVQKVGSIGLPLWGIQCKIVDDSGKEVPSGEVGELIIKGDNVMVGYYNDEEKTKNTLKDGWLYTGDMAKQDQDGYYFIVDRKKELIIISGFNVYPREVEEVIYSYPKVKEAAVIGVKNESRGEYVKAFVVLKEGEVCSSKDLLHYLRERLANYKIPRKIEFVQDLPKNATGKIMKRLLK